MNIDIKKITNGYVVNINGVETFCDVPEAICGMTSQWVLDQCKMLDSAKAKVDVHDTFAQAMQQQWEAAEKQVKMAGAKSGEIVRIISEREESHWSDAFKYILSGRRRGS